ncbi:unnamed protein product [Discosporangium mesarthrocarpum]
MVPEEDMGITGRFEVVLVNTGELIHSQILRGQGRCETPAQIEAVAQHVQRFLDSA